MSRSCFRFLRFNIFPFVSNTVSRNSRLALSNFCYLLFILVILRFIFDQFTTMIEDHRFQIDE